ncbi:AraC family transcriptional regulator [Maricurvus nonylphenolicus]|uniref:AraC family transcriptional regulator n=1 Tax=Maricurvus nonylphenolicus TaxID=1008307 RepID=UPI0036F27C33
MTSSQPPAIFSALRLKGIKPVLDKMVYLGFDLKACLNDTGITVDQLSASDELRGGISLEQEFTLYENILRLSGSPHIGLELGTAYSADSLGILGYAQMSAKNMEESIKIATSYSPLTLTYFKPVMIKQDDFGGIALEKQYEVPEHLLQVFSDRAVKAVISIATSYYDHQNIFRKIHLMHNDCNKALYEKSFGCEVEFGHHRNEILIKKEDMLRPFPESDPEFSRKCLEQCRKIMHTFQARSELISQIKEIILSEPGYFPKANEVAEKLGCTPRTLRRKLSQEGEHYQTLVNEVRAELAKRYLKSDLPLDAIAEMLGFSEAAAFSNAFKVWESISPSEYRESHQHQ